MAERQSMTTPEVVAKTLIDEHADFLREAVAMEAYVNGVSTRKVDRLVEELGIGGMSKDRVSHLCRGLDERVEAFRNRPLEGEFPYLWLDAKHLKVRSAGHVRSKALVVAYAVHETGRREVIGIDIGEVETEAFWVEFLRGLRARGLAGVRLASSDHHEGLKSAIERILDCPWQRCTVHFVRNMQGHCRRSERGLVAAALREIFDARTSRRRRRGSARCSSAFVARWRRSPSFWRGPRRTFWPSTGSRLRTGRSCAAPIRWSGSTRRSAGELMSLASSPTTPQRSAWSARC